VTRTLTLKAEGLTAAQLPSLAMADSDGFKAYPDQPHLDDQRSGTGIRGTRQEKIALIPTRAGELTLPGMQISWWNTSTRRMEVARLPDHTVKVSPAPNVPAGSQTLPQPQSRSAAPEPGDSETQLQGVAVGVAVQRHWNWVTIVLGLGWLITAVAWLISNRIGRARSQHPKADRRADDGASLKEVKKACLENDAPQARAALLRWASAYWNGQPAVNLVEIGQRMDQGVMHELAVLNQVLYGAAGEAWRGEGLWQALSAAVKRRQSPRAQPESAIVPLYPD
jgi:hypothetical protein